MKKIISILNNINKKYKDLYQTKFKNVLQFLPSNIYLFFLFVILLITVIPKILNNNVCIYSTSSEQVSAKEIVKERIFQEIDTSNIAKINELGVKFSTFKRKNKSTYKFIVYKNEKKIFIETINSKSLVDNEYKIFKINSKVSKNDKFKFELKPVNVSKGNGITITKNDDGNYSYRLYAKSNFYKEVLILSIVFIIIFMFINYLINNGKIKNEEHYYKIMGIYFILVIFVFPPLFAPDSPYHFNRAYNISQNNILEIIKTDRLSTKNEPSNIDCIKYGDKGGYFFEVNNSDLIKKCFESKKLIKKKNTINMQNKIAYIIPGLGIKFAKIFTNSPMVLFLTGRLFNAVISFLIILYALKVAPSHKRILLSIVMIPVFIQQMCSYSYDSILNSLCILEIAYLLKFFTIDEKIKTKDLIIYLISILIISKIKFPYVLVGLPIIFVSKEKYKNNKIGKIIYIILMALILSAFYILSRLGSEMSVIDTSGSGERGMSLNSLFNIKNTIRIIHGTIKYNTIFYLETFIGGLAWLNFTFIPKLLIYSYLLFICLGIVADNQKIKFKKIYKIFIILFNLALIGGIFLAMYLSWTTPNALAIEGVQGRYLFAPILMIILMLIPKNNKINISNDTFYSFFNISSVIYLITILYLFY